MEKRFFLDKTQSISKLTEIWLSKNDQNESPVFIDNELCLNNVARLTLHIKYFLKTLFKQNLYHLILSVGMYTINIKQSSIVSMFGDTLHEFRKLQSKY